MSSEKPIRVAICGVSGIGRVHARIFHSLGAEICAILGSSDETAGNSARKLEKSTGIYTYPYSSFETLLNEKMPDAISICTPPHLHFEEMLVAFDRNIPVFCEKPIFWHKNITQNEVEKKLADIETHPGRRLFINTSNSIFMDAIGKKGIESEKIRLFFFHFYTQGISLGRDIALDLLPHGISLLLRLLGPTEIRDLTEKIDEHNYRCRFSYGNCAAEFDFQESPDGPKSLIFAINKRKFIRIQEGEGATYRVFLKDSYTGEKIEVQDPFHVYIKRFLDYCNNGVPAQKDEFDEAATNLRLMANILLKEAI